ncbi:MAG TPA: DNA repair protein RecO [Pirellulales bacterium]|jgi:DNA repair protein RecO (recombination protein O)
MSAEKTLALVLRVVEFSESSSVVTLFTRDFGKIRGLAKGARRPKGPFESALDLLSLCRLVFLRKSSEALDLLTEAKLERRFRPANHDLSNLYAGYYVAELLNELTDDSDPQPDLFDAADETLVALAQRIGPVDGVVLRWEMTALRILGHQPALANCAECGRLIAATSRVSFGQLAGGVLCTTCRPGKRQIVSVSAAALTALQKLADPQNDGGQNQPLERAIAGELRGLMNQYMCNLLGKKLRMHSYLATKAT